MFSFLHNDSVGSRGEIWLLTVPVSPPAESVEGPMKWFFRSGRSVQHCFWDLQVELTGGSNGKESVHGASYYGNLSIQSKGRPERNLAAPLTDNVLESMTK